MAFLAGLGCAHARQRRRRRIESAQRAVWAGIEPAQRQSRAIEKRYVSCYIALTIDRSLLPCPTSARRPCPGRWRCSVPGRVVRRGRAGRRGAGGRGRQLRRADGAHRRGLHRRHRPRAQAVVRRHRQVLRADRRRRALRGAARGRRRDAEEAGRRRPCRGRQPLHLCHRPAGAVERAAGLRRRRRARCWRPAAFAHLAIANPKVAPYGARGAGGAASARGLADALAPKLVTARASRRPTSSSPPAMPNWASSRCRRCAVPGKPADRLVLAGAGRAARRDPAGRGAAEGRRDRTPPPWRCWPT